MKRSAFKPKKLTDAQKQLREAFKLNKSLLRKGRKRISSRRCQYRGIQFDSQWERACYIELYAKQTNGEISNLSTHEIIPILIKNEANQVLRITINVDFVFYDNNLKRWVRADAKPPKKLDSQKKDWFLRWSILQHVDPDYQYILYRQHSTWREVDI